MIYNDLKQPERKEQYTQVGRPLKAAAKKGREIIRIPQVNTFMPPSSEKVDLMEMSPMTATMPSYRGDQSKANSPESVNAAYLQDGD